MDADLRVGSGECASSWAQANRARDSNSLLRTKKKLFDKNLCVFRTTKTMFVVNSCYLYLDGVSDIIGIHLFKMFILVFTSVQQITSLINDLCLSENL